MIKTKSLREVYEVSQAEKRAKRNFITERVTKVETLDVGVVSKAIESLEEMTKASIQLTPKLTSFVHNLGIRLVEATLVHKSPEMFETTLNEYAAVCGFFTGPALGKLLEQSVVDKTKLQTTFLTSPACALSENTAALEAVAKEVSSLSHKQLSTFRQHCPTMNPVLSEASLRRVSKLV